MNTPEFIVFSLEDGNERLFHTECVAIDLHDSGTKGIGVNKQENSGKKQWPLYRIKITNY